uniref:DUF295 domain-containing protein n=1 Tax=Setaria italica TaxID=4555 RepID=K4A2W2_SETIT
RKRPAVAMEEEGRNWASLLPDLLNLVAARLLAVDVVDYISFRVVRARWRASAPSPRDPTLRDPCLHPRGWVALCDGDGVRPANAFEVAFFHAATGGRLRVRLPELRGHRIVGFTDGLLILINKETTTVRVLHPFIRAAVDLPPIAAIFNHMASADSIAVVAWFPTVPGVVVAEHSSPCWYIVYHSVELASAISFQGRVLNARNLTHKFFLVESAVRLILVLRHFHFDNFTEGGYRPCQFALFEVDTVGHRELTPVSSLGDQAVFLSRDRCFLRLLWQLRPALPRQHNSHT